MRYLIPAALALVIALAVACGDDDNATNSPTSTHTASATTSASATTTHSPATTSSPLPTAMGSICGANPDPATSSEAVITAPLANAQLSSPLVVSGTIAAFEAVFQISIKDAAGNDIVTQSGMASEGQTLAPFGESVPFTVTAQTPACVWVFQISAMDGVSPVNVTQIPVTLVP
jgi:hypothetical protein